MPSEPPSTEPLIYENRLQATSTESLHTQFTPQQTDPPEETHAKASEGSRILDTWFYEILATIFSIGCFVAIVAILMVYDGKPTPTFTYSLTLNTLISILATASKASLLFMIGECTGQLKWLWFYNGEEKRRLDGMQLFDSASRGPLGALWVLFRHKGRSLVSLGALVMVLSTPYNAFVQQILTYPIRNTVVATNSSQALARRAVSLLLPLLGDDEEDIVQIGQWSDTFVVDPTCQSGNCTWPLFQSVEMCSQCEDVTNSSAVDCVPFPVNTTIPDDGDYPTRVCSIVSPHGYGSTQITLYDNTNGSFRIDMPLEQVWALAQWTWKDELPYPASAIGYAQVGVAGKEQYLGGFPLDLDIGGILEVTRATECTLRLCARTYNVTVSNGAVSIAKGEPNYGAQFWVDKRNGTAIPGKHADWDFSSAFLRANYSTCWRPTDGPAVQLTQNADKTTWVNEAEMAFCPVSEFVVGQYLEGKRRAAYTSGHGDIEPQSNPDPSIKRIRTIGLEESVSRIAASFTRQALLASNTTVQGTVHIPEVYVSVEWLWILHPAALTALAVVFLASTIFVNHRRHLKLWKTSILAVLYHDRNGTVSRMEKTAQGVRVRLTTVDEKRGLMLD
jgi:hypothetical protein